MRILALVPGGISDQILFFPTLEDLSKHYPQATLDVIVEPRAKPAYRVCPHVHEVLLFDYRDRNGLADYLNLLGIIRDREYDAALSLSQDWTVALLLWLNGIPLRVGYKTNTSWFLSNTVPWKTEQYAAEADHDLLSGLGLQSPCPSLKVTVPKEDIDWAEAEQKRLDLKDSGYILIHGGARELPQENDRDFIYPLAKWQQIVDDIQQKQPNLPVVLLEFPAGDSWSREMQEVCPNLKVICPSDIGKLAAGIAGANLMVCTEGGPLHLAVAVGTYTIALFGPTKASKLLPSDQDRYIGIQSSTGKVADIEPTTLLGEIWRS